MESPRYRNDEDHPDGSGRHRESSPPDLEFVWPPTEADLDRLAVVWLDETARARHEATMERPVSGAPSRAATVAPVTPGASTMPGALVTPRVSAPRPSPPTLDWPPSADDLRAITVLERGSRPVPIAPGVAVPSPGASLLPPVSSRPPVTRHTWSRLQLAAVVLGVFVVMAATARPMLDRLREPALQPTPTPSIRDDVAEAEAPAARLEAPTSAENTAIPSPPPVQADSTRALQADDVVGGTPLARDREPTRETTRAPAPRPAAEPDRQPMAARDAPVARVGIAAPAAPPGLGGLVESAPPGVRVPVESAPPPAPQPDTTPRVEAAGTVVAALPEIPATLPARVSIGGTPAPASAGSGDAAARTVTRLPAPPDDEARIRAILGRYRTAYQQLDASAAKAVWPSLDQRALARAFEGLRLQEVVFDACRLSLDGETAAATCQGKATYVARVGNSEPRVQPRQWTFVLRRAGANWLIQDVRVR